MATIPSSAVSQYERMQALQLVALKAGRRAWNRVSPQDISGTWVAAMRPLIPVIAATQYKAAVAGADYGTFALAEQGQYVPPDAFVDPAGFAGVASDGRTLEGLLYSAATTTKSFIGDGHSVAKSLSMGRGSLDSLLRTTIADAGRQAASADIASRQSVGYIRMLNAPSCGSCVILAGRFYRWNAGFQRHNKCDCIHVPAKGAEALRSEGLIDDPYEYFTGLPESEQNRIFGAGKAQAIRDGGDIYQVQNSWRGKNGIYTTEGTGRRGNARSVVGQRLTPDGIYKTSTNRAEALKKLEQHGYILPGGQVPGGVLRGDREGFGALGRGGTRVGAWQAVEDARRTGVRTGSRYTMTEAERRLTDSRLRYEAVLEGRNPYGKAPLTPDIAARVESDFRRWLTTEGQIYKP